MRSRGQVLHSDIAASYRRDVTDSSYDPLDRLTTVASGGQMKSYAYDVGSNPVTTTLPSGTAMSSYFTLAGCWNPNDRDRPG